MGRTPHTVSRCRCLDLVQIAHRDRIEPLAFCHIRLDGPIDRERLAGAVDRLAHSVPELLCACDPRRSRWVDRGFGAADVLAAGPLPPDSSPAWDLSSAPQLRILLDPEPGRHGLLVGVSHILCDGAGFLQLLSLLAALYSGREPNPPPRNRRDIRPILARAGGPGPLPAGARRASDIPVSALPFAPGGRAARCLVSVIEAGPLASLRDRARVSGRTLNDLFLAAYARAVCKRLGAREVLLPCPVDLRRLAPPPEGRLSVANMTGMIHIPVAVPPGDRFEDTLVAVHIAVRERMEARRCLAGIGLLRRLDALLPAGMIKAALRGRYTILPVSYTNVGAIDAGRLRFAGRRVLGCFVTGAYRRGPDFQMAVSSFDGVCTLNCTLLGDSKRFADAQGLLDEIRDELLAWGDG